MNPSAVHDCIWKEHAGPQLWSSHLEFLGFYEAAVVSIVLSPSLQEIQRQKSRFKSTFIEHTNSLTFSIFLQGRWFLPSWIPRRTSVAGIGRAAGNSLLWVRHEPAGKMEKKSWGAWKEAGPSPAASVLPQHALWAAILTERAVTDKHQLTNRVGEDRQSSLSLSGTLFLQNTKARSSTYALRTWLPSQRDGCRGPLSICCIYMQMHAA